MNNDFDPAYTLRRSPEDRWLFRPVFDFSDGRPTWFGGWYPASRKEDTASAVDTRNLLFAYVEGKHFTSKEVRRFAEIPGPEFESFRRLAVLYGNDQVSVNHTYGMEAIARTYKIVVTEDGASNHEKKIIAS